MSRRPVNPARRLVGNGGFSLAGAFPPKTRSSPLLSLTLVLLGAFLILGYLYSGSGHTHVVSRIEGEFSGTLEVQGAIPALKKSYGNAMRKVLHVGPETCSVVSKLLKEENTEAWGVEPYDIEDADSSCKNLISKGLVRVSDVKFRLPYRSKSFSLVIVSDTLDYLSPKYLNKTVPELARVAGDGVVIFTGHPGQQRARVTELSKFGRPYYVELLGVFDVKCCRDLAEMTKAKMRSQSWWMHFFHQIGLEVNDAASKKFEEAASKESYKPNCQVFHVKSFH
ncbi:putative pectin methylesterase CGR2 [Drosera capensis]